MFVFKRQWQNASRIKELEAFDVGIITWRKEMEESTASMGVVPRGNRSLRKTYHNARLDNSLHGGSGYTGRLSVGWAAPNGSESFQSDDNPRQASKAWMNAVMAGGSSPVKYSSASPAVDLHKMSEDWLRLYMARATDPGTFVKAVLAYYKEDTMIDLDNISVDSTKINDPENEETISNLDSIYRYLTHLDRRHMMSEKDRARFLLLCDDFLSNNMGGHHAGEKQTSENADAEKYRARRAASTGIKHELESFAARLPLDPVRQQIDTDRKASPKKMRVVPSTHCYTL